MTVDRCFCEGFRRMHSTFQVVVGGEELTVGTRNLVHLAGPRGGISVGRPYAPGN